MPYSRSWPTISTRRRCSLSVMCSGVGGQRGRERYNHSTDDVRRPRGPAREYGEAPPRCLESRPLRRARGGSIPGVFDPAEREAQHRVLRDASAAECGRIYETGHLAR